MSELAATPDQNLSFARLRALGSAKLWPWFALALVWLLFNLTVNSTFPASTDVGAWLRPSWEVTLLIASYAAWLAWVGSVGARTHASVAVGLVLVRLFRFVDGCYVYFFHREFKLAVDLPLLPESVRLLVTTDGLVMALLQIAGGLVLLAILGWVSFRALGILEHALGSLVRAARLAQRQPVSRASLGVCMLVGAGAVPLVEGDTELGIAHRLYTEARFFLEYPELRRSLLERFHATAAALQRAPHGLEALRGRNVSLILIESYGRGALDSATHRPSIERALARLGTRLAERELAVASAWLGPPTYGGGSWFAHATLTTGVRVWLPLDYDLLLGSEVVPLSRFMKRAGYSTLNVMPGTTRAWPQAEFYGFDQTLYAKDFDYTGPWLSWGRFPDQYVLDHVRRCCSERQSLYKELKLVSSHVPWRAVPPVVDDWDAIRKGDVYHRAAGTREYSMKWSDLKHAHDPYIASIVYDLDVVGDYIRRFETKDTLVFILGDHQPVKEASRSDLWDVPVHVAGPEDLVAHFRASTGFAPGLRPPPEAKPLPMEEFLPLFLRNLSEPR
ncbi:MAG TPA: hypothetical protein VFU02_02605 [Polyangiaceae bacterium]|nr:hypothetical protein [Polyangiaceae bacterium]